MGRCAWPLYFSLRRNAKSAVVIGACVVSHWFLDVIAHRPDLPVFPQGPFVGLGLWNSLPATVAIECGLLALGLTLYLRATRAKDRIGVYGLWSLMVVLVAAWISSLFGPPPPSERRSEEHTSELQSPCNLVCRLLLEKKK